MSIRAFDIRMQHKASGLRAVVRTRFVLPG
jgi:hypothetical protein